MCSLIELGDNDKLKLNYLWYFEFYLSISFSFSFLFDSHTLTSALSDHFWLFFSHLFTTKNEGWRSYCYYLTISVLFFSNISSVHWIWIMKKREREREGGSSCYTFYSISQSITLPLTFYFAKKKIKLSKLTAFLLFFLVLWILQYDFFTITLSLFFSNAMFVSLDFTCHDIHIPIISTHFSSLPLV